MNSLLLGLYITSSFCLWILLVAIIINFYFSINGKVEKQKKSFVETGSMLAFFVLMVLLVYLRLGRINLNIEWELLSAGFGTLLIVAGVAVNLAGRLKLKGNWGNQIMIYKDHTLVTTGIYKYIRHPLYASTILMIYGFSFLFVNLLVFVLNTIIFIPVMIFRSGQEDQLLVDKFKEEFIEYKSKTGMLLPFKRR